MHPQCSVLLVVDQNNMGFIEFYYLLCIWGLWFSKCRKWIHEFRKSTARYLNWIPWNSRIYCITIGLFTKEFSILKLENLKIKERTTLRRTTKTIPALAGRLQDPWRWIVRRLQRVEVVIVSNAPLCRPFNAFDDFCHFGSHFLARVRPV